MPVDKKKTTIIELAKKFLQMTISAQAKNPRVRPTFLEVWQNWHKRTYLILLG